MQTYTIELVAVGNTFTYVLCDYKFGDSLNLPEYVKLMLVISDACMSDQSKSILYIVSYSQVSTNAATFPTAPIKEAPASIHEAWKYCKDHSRSVELYYRNMDGDKILTRVHFQFDPEVSTVCVFVCSCVL